jgi:hypothetical protein
MTFGRPLRPRAKPGIAWHRRANCGAPLAALAAIAILAMPAAAAEDAEIAHRRSIERKDFSDADIIDGFFKVTFGAEFHVAGGVDRIRKYDGPIRVYIDNRAQPDRSVELTAVVADIRKRVRGLDIVMTGRRDDAQIVVSLVRDRDLAHAIRTLYGIDRARRIQRSLEPQCLSGFRKDENSRILHSDVLIVADAGEFVFYDCIYEELLQSLGPKIGRAHV